MMSPNSFAVRQRHNVIERIAAIRVFVADNRTIMGKFVPVGPITTRFLSRSGAHLARPLQQH
ncbi:MAG TPA: hypothetical protein VGO37_04130 [Steroidobacteraceae bacterium]|nr:hypothetical protein [Steroidobacteraceae bacterium]